jgi:hypothetical protein
VDALLRCTSGSGSTIAFAPVMTTEDDFDCPGCLAKPASLPLHPSEADPKKSGRESWCVELHVLMCI